MIRLSSLVGLWLLAGCASDLLEDIEDQAFNRAADSGDGNHASAPPGLVNASSRGSGSGIARAGSNGIIDLSTSECFNRPVSSIFEYPEGRYKRPFIVKGSVGNTYDLRGSLFEANPLMFPVLFDDPHDTCVVGASVQGQQERNLTWSEVKSQTAHIIFDGDGIGWENPTGKFVIEGAWIDNMEDGVGQPFDLVPDRSTTWSLRHVYARHIRDDMLENDGCLTGDVQDSFFDGIWTLYSGKPSKPARPLVQGSATLTIRDSLIRFVCMRDDRQNGSTCPNPDQWGAGQVFKNGVECNLKIKIEDSIFLIEDIKASGADFDPANYENVTVIWTGGGSYPGRIPSGVKFTTDKSIWDKARADWLKRHGCDTNGENCSYLNHSGISKSPPSNSEPYVVMSSSPSFMPLGRGGTIEWWAENVSSCTPSGLGLALVGGNAGQRRMGPRQVAGWSNTEQQIMYGISCKAPDGSTVADSDRLTWFNRSSDGQKPSVPEGATAMASQGKITVTWNESSDNFAIATYRIYRNGTWLANVSSKPTFVDTAVSAGTSYSYQVEAMDAFGNLSGKSSPASTTAE